MANKRLRDEIEEAMRQSLKEQNTVLLSTLRMLITALRNREIDKRAKLSKAGESSADAAEHAFLTDEETMEVIRLEAKRRKEAIQEFGKAGRNDLARKEQAELLILEQYLPAELSDEEVERTIHEVIAGAGAVSAKDFGRIMSEVMKRLNGKASGDRVSGAVRAKLDQAS